MRTEEIETNNIEVIKRLVASDGIQSVINHIMFRDEVETLGILIDDLGCVGLFDTAPSNKHNKEIDRTWRWISNANSLVCKTQRPRIHYDVLQ